MTQGLKYDILWKFDLLGPQQIGLRRVDVLSHAINQLVDVFHVASVSPGPLCIFDSSKVIFPHKVRWCWTRYLAQLSCSRMKKTFWGMHHTPPPMPHNELVKRLSVLGDKVQAAQDSGYALSSGKCHAKKAGASSFGFTKPTKLIWVHKANEAPKVAYRLNIHPK